LHPGGRGAKIQLKIVEIFLGRPLAENWLKKIPPAVGAGFLSSQP